LLLGLLENPSRVFMNWEVKVIGDLVDLRMLVEALVDPCLAIVERDSEFFLRSSELDTLQDPEPVRERAHEMMAFLSGASKLLLGSTRIFGVDHVVQVDDRGARHRTLVPGTSHLELRGLAPTLVFTHAEGTVERRLPASPVSDAARKARESGAVEKVLRLWGATELLWPDLYRIFEVIEDDSDSKGIIRWASKKQIERFTRTANSVAAAGDISRHGKERTFPPPDPMTLAEGHGFIEGIIWAWLSSK